MINFSDDPHRRFNILTKEWVLVSPHRSKRPWQGKEEKAPLILRPTYDEACYLCPGNKRSNGSMNPNYTSTYSFTNDFAALHPNGSDAEYNNGLLQAQGEKGICKVICFSPDHSMTLPHMSLEAIEKVIQLWQREYQELGKLPYINHVQIFENKGGVMGCSNAHPHGQIWAQASIPGEVQKKSTNQKEYWNQYGSSMLQDYWKQEAKLSERIIHENEHFITLIPFWAIWPYEAMILPKRSIQNVIGLTANEKTSFAKILKKTTQIFDQIFETSFPYSSGIHQATTNGIDQPEWCMHMSFYPPLLRSATVKKFMVGYEMFAEPQRDITTEIAAQQMRNIAKTLA